MRHLIALIVLFVISPCIAAEPSRPLPPAAARTVNFVQDIKPLFEASCIQCHAKGKDKGGLSLETRQSLLKGGDSGPAAMPGKSDESYIVKMVAGVDPDEVMPKKGTKWTADQVGLLRAWIDQGMPWDTSITFAKPEPLNLKSREVEVPAGTQNALNQLLADYAKRHAIALPAVVKDRVFARRVYLDTIGLLPTPAQLESFLADPSPDKRQQLVRTLLADRRGYADNWLTFWNDLLRNDYRGTGFIDGGRRQISGWLYAALLNNEPYDRFVSELVNPNQSSEGFSRGIIWRGSVNASQLPPMQAAQNISQVFMGVNLKCASCHDSFINDWTLADAYGMAALYSDVPLELVHCDKPTGKMSAPRFLYPQLGTIDPKLDGKQRLSRLAELMTSSSDGRLSRTIVNRLWQRLLGRGLVEPVDDMEKPAWSGEILDWLADDLVAHHYDLKHTIEVILCSRAYQLPAVEPALNEKQFVFRGPAVRRLTAEQFCDALTTLSGDWARMPATLNIDYAAGHLVDHLEFPQWIWTEEPVAEGQAKADEQYEKDRAEKKEIANLEATEEEKAADADEAAKNPNKKSDADKPDPDRLPRHKVVFRRGFVLQERPAEAYAAMAASQSFSLSINGKDVRPIMSDSERRGRIALYDLKSALAPGDNLIVMEVSSHTEKSLNDAEKLQYPASRNHVNTVSGVGFYLRATFGREKKVMELISDSSWLVDRAPEGKFKEAKYQDEGWSIAISLPQGVEPIDEGSALPPIARKDFANEPIELADPLRRACTTAAQPGHIRASLEASNPLMTALDRPNREQVMTVRSTAATTLQCLELTNGSTLDQRLKRAAQKLTPQAQKDPSAWMTQLWRQMLDRDPTASERDLAMQLLGDKVQPQAVADVLWAITVLPEFQLIR
jgi:hypothetical protein